MPVVSVALGTTSTHSSMSSPARAGAVNRGSRVHDEGQGAPRQTLPGVERQADPAVVGGVGQLGDGQLEVCATAQRFGVTERVIEPGHAVAHARHALEPGGGSERIAVLHRGAVGQRVGKLHGVYGRKTRQHDERWAKDDAQPRQSVTYLASTVAVSA